jgi:hypothetical protein
MTTPPAFTAHELSALAEQGMTLTEAEEATVREARGQTVQHVTDISTLIAEMRAGLEGIAPDLWSYRPYDHDDWGTVRGPKHADDIGTPIASVRSPYANEKALHRHRVERTDPYERHGRHIARCSPANIASLLDEIERLRADNARLTAGLEHAESVFLRYAEMHDAKGTPDGRTKADANLQEAYRCRRARTAMEASNGK